ncbi:MAG: 50S ribosomal protein L32 [Patescibacteria group bacterium]|jgi:large subunit ribosomal protein L32
MGLPGKKLPKSAKGPRLARLKQIAANLTSCPKCKKPIRPHQSCRFCGYYKGREVVAVKFKAGKSKAKAETKNAKS